MLVIFGLYTSLANCGDPISETDSSISLLEFNDPGPALEGVTVNFTCAPRLTLTGPNSTTCTESGLWKESGRNNVTTAFIELHYGQLDPFLLSHSQHIGWERGIGPIAGQTSLR